MEKKILTRQKRASKGVGNYDIVLVRLIYISLDEDPLKVVDEDVFEKYYDLTISHVSLYENSLMGMCDCIAGKRRDEENVSRIYASYMFVVDFKNEVSFRERKEACERVASNQVWMMFRDIVHVMSGQACLDLPLLPIVPEKVGCASSCKFSPEKNDSE